MWKNVISLFVLPAIDDSGLTVCKYDKKKKKKTVTAA